MADGPEASYHFLPSCGPAAEHNVSPRVKIERSLRIGDVLTSLTIVVSVVALLVAWSKDRALEERAQADKIRSAAAKVVAKLDRWQALQESLFQGLQPVFVETSERLASKFDVIGARDYLWKEINRERTNISAKILNEEIKTAYVDLIPHFPSSRERVIESFVRLDSLEEDMTLKLLRVTQQDILGFEQREKEYQTAALGNALRDSASKVKNDFRIDVNKALTPLRHFLLEIISMSNDALLDAARKSQRANF